MTARHLVCAAVLFAAFPPGTAAEKPRPARPAGKDVQVEVVRGGSVRIPLRGFERNLNRLVYRVLENPRCGRLSNLEQYDGPDRQGAGSITYTHGDDDESTEDVFIFEVRAAATKLAGRGRVSIRVVDSPAQLLAPAVLDFGRVAVGDPPASRRLELANIGGGILQGSLEVPAPFALGGEGNFVLRRGRSTAIPVIFAPERAGPYSFPVQPVSGDPATVILRGEAVSPFMVDAKETKFSVNDDGSRSLTAQVVNNSQTPRDITVGLPPDSPIEPVAPLALAPGESGNVVLRIPPGHKTGIPDFPVYFKDQDREQMLTLAAPAIPAKLVIVREPDFGVILPRRTPKATLVLRNDGGSAAEGRLQQSDTLVSADGLPAFRIEPGGEYTMELELRLRKDSTPPTEGVLVFRGANVPFRLTASMAATAPTPTPTPVEPALPPPPQSRPAWELDSDIGCISTADGLAIRWTEKDGWTNVIVQNRTDAASPWRDYRFPDPREGMLGWLQGLFEWVQSLGDKIQAFLDKPIDRNTVEEFSGEEEKFGQTPIAACAPGGKDLWRLQATPSSSGEPRTVSPVFRIEKDRKLVAVTEQPETTPSPAAAPAITRAPPPAPPVVRPRALGPVTPIVFGGSKAERRGATVQTAFARELDIRGFRLERGAMVSAVDPKTGASAAPEFEPLKDPEAGVETLFFGEGEVEGRKLTVCAARIDGLRAGTRTYWRLVPAGPDGDLPPTTAFYVDTLPDPPIPWSKIILGILFLLLAAVLYLRWKINRRPG